MAHKSAPVFALLIALGSMFALSDEVLASIGIGGGRRQNAPPQPSVVKRDAVPRGKLPEMPAWLNDYAAAIHKAKTEQKMLLVHFCQDRDPNCAAIERTLMAPQIRQTLQRYVLARVSTNASISQQGQPLRLL